MTIFSSRSFSSRALHPESGKYWSVYKSQHPSSPRQTVLLDMSRTPAEDLDFPVLFPGLDAANHNHDAKVDWAFDPGRFGIATAGDERIEAGSEVFNNYGPKGNGELLLGYGFCSPNNPHDTVALALKTPVDGLQAGLRSLHPGFFTEEGSWNAEKGTFDLKQSLNGSQSSEEEIIHHLPVTLVELLLYILRHERGLPFFVPRPLEYLTLFGSQGRRYLPHIARMIVQSLAPKLAKLQSANLPLEPGNPKQEQAAIYRQSQVSILSFWISAFRTYTRSLIFHPTATDISPVPRRPCLMTLETFLAVLSHHNTSVTTDFVKGIEANANTSDLEQLRLAGWEEDIWVLLICYLLLSSENQLKQWLSNALPEYIPLPSAQSRAEIRSDLAAFGAEELEQANGLIPLIHAAASACGPASVWSDPRWTPEFVAGAGGRMMQWESFVVMIPGGDEDEEEARLCVYLHFS